MMKEPGEKPLVVIVGWLGCHRRSVRRYEVIYENCGFQVLSVVPSSCAIARASYKTEASNVSEQVVSDRGTMKELACYVMEEIEARQATEVLFHLFSNGGGFLWESFRHAVDSNGHRHVEGKIKGVVFDSSPCWFGDDASLLTAALAHVVEEDRQEVGNVFGPNIFVSETSQQRIQRKKRSYEYFRFLVEDKLDIPQLYLYCRGDKLADSQRIESVILFRKSNYSQPVMRKRWRNSVHCAHLMRHPKEYTNEITGFISMCIRRSRI